MAAYVALIAAALTTTGTLVEGNQQAKAAEGAQHAAAKQQQEAEAAAKAQADAQAAQQNQAQGSDISAQLKANIAAGEQQAPGLSPSFYGAEAQSQYPGFSDLINQVVNQYGSGNTAGTGQ